jgi:spermidine/putrescine transport system substrate-binding protein
MKAGLTPPPGLTQALALAALALAAGVLACCQPARASGPDRKKLAGEITVYTWSEDRIGIVADAFAREFGVKVRVETYESQEEAIELIRAGAAVHDLVIMDSQLIPTMLASGLLAPIDYRNVTNFKNIAADFRNLAYDPDNKHSIPYSWGTTGLVVRNDRIVAPITRWADLWDPRYAGRVIVWESAARHTLGVALKALGYSANSEDPAELEAALRRLLELKPVAVVMAGADNSLAPALLEGDAAFGVGWAYDYKSVRERSETVSYVLPEEGALMWVDSFVIPANSRSKYTAEVFLDFLLRPEITGRLVNENHYAMPNDLAGPHIDPAIREDPVIYPTGEQLKGAEMLLPPSEEGQKRYDDIWDRFLAAPPAKR